MVSITGRFHERLSLVRRTLAGLLFGLAYTCASLALAGFLLERSAFDPEHAADAADVILADPAIRQQVTFAVADAVAAQLQVDPVSMRTRVEQVATTTDGARLLGTIVRDAHAKLIGASDAPVMITGQQLVDATQMQAAAEVPPVTLDVPTVSALDIARTTVGWLVPITAIAAVILLIAGFAAHPDREAIVRMLAIGLLMLAGLVVVLGYVVPKWLVPVVDDSPWSQVPALLADDSRGLVIALALLLAGAGGALFAAGGMAGRRRQWSAPVSTYRYQEERRWS